MFKCSCLRDLGKDISVKSLRDIFVTVSFFPFLLYSWKKAMAEIDNLRSVFCLN